MDRFDQNTFDRFIIENGVIGFFKDPIKLKSGALSNWYVNWRTVAEDAYLLDQLTDFIMAFARSKDLAVDTFYGVPEGASKLGILTQFKWAKSHKNFAKGSHVLAMGRGKAKDHGDPKDKYFLGMPTGNVIVLEDVTTTGGSLVQTIKQLQDNGATIIAAIALTNRNESAIDLNGIPYFAMSSLQKYETNH